MTRKAISAALDQLRSKRTTTPRRVPGTVMNPKKSKPMEATTEAHGRPTIRKTTEIFRRFPFTT
jgi:hypothetical protein